MTPRKLWPNLPDCGARSASRTYFYVLSSIAQVENRVGIPTVCMYRRKHGTTKRNRPPAHPAVHRHEKVPYKSMQQMVRQALQDSCTGTRTAVPVLVGIPTKWQYQST